MKRIVLLALCATWLVGCFDTGPKGFASVRLDPILDSVFVGDQLLAPSVTYFDENGVPSTPAPSAISWSTNDPDVVSIDPATGQITGLKRGLAVITAVVQGVGGVALIAVSNTLDLTLLLDSIYLMPDDTITIPVVVQKKTPPEPDVWYESLNPAVFTVDSASGSVTALATGGPIPYIVHADTIADTGAVSVLALADTTGGRFFFSVRGTANSFVGGEIRAVNYARSNGELAFRLRGVFAPGGPPLQTVQITLPDSVVFADSAYAIDSISPSEADQLTGNQFTAICIPPRAWALWSYQSAIIAYSRRGGTLGVTQIDTVPNGLIISGQFRYTAQRRDLYSDPLGALAVRGTFVAPFVTDRTTCR